MKGVYFGFYLCYRLHDGLNFNLFSPVFVAGPRLLVVLAACCVAILIVLLLRCSSQYTALVAWQKSQGTAKVRQFNLKDLHLDLDNQVYHTPTNKERILVTVSSNHCLSLAACYFEAGSYTCSTIQGGAGYIGSHAALYLLEDGHMVTILVRYCGCC